MSRLALALTLLLTLGHASFCLADDWPHWRGIERDDITGESSGWEQGWKKKTVLWETNVGQGSSSPIVADGHLYTMGWVDGNDVLYCFDAVTGEEEWTQSYAAPRYGRHAMGDQGLYSGPTSTPEFDTKTKRLYTLSCDGDLNCWDTTQRGAKVWSLNLYDNYGMERRPKVGRSGRRDYGYTTAPLIHREQLIVEVGSEQGTLVGFDKRTGKELWRSEATGFAGHTGGLAPMTVENIPCVAVLTFDGLLVARLDAGNEGKTVATFEWITSFVNNIATPAVHEDSVVVTSGYNQHATCRLKITLKGAEVVWKNEQDYSKTCSPVIFEGKIYWAWGQIRCLDFETGKSLWRRSTRAGDAGSCIVTKDKKLLTWCGRGDLILAETLAAPEGKYRELARFSDLGSDDVWPHLAYANGRAYCKDRKGNLTCLALNPTP